MRLGLRSFGFELPKLSNFGCLYEGKDYLFGLGEYLPHSGNMVVVSHP